jgi:D-alanine-D-alanine ligase
VSRARPLRKLRVLALMHEGLVPPDQIGEGIDTTAEEWRMEYDVVSTLRGKGHEVHCLGLGSDLALLRLALAEVKPQIVFNLLEDFHDVTIFDQNVVSYLELLRKPYTGCNPRGLILARDKALTKQLLTYHRIRSPEFAVFPRHRAVRRPKGLGFPLIVKSLTQESSAGISQASVVGDDAKLRERVQFIHDSVGTDAIAEQYIEGRELYVGVLGNRRLQVLPIWEMYFKSLPEESYAIATDRVKWNAKYRARHGITTGQAEGLPDALLSRIRNLARRVYRALWLSGYARLDLRLSGDGEPYVIEANPNPQLANGEDLADMAQRAGIEYGRLLERILRLGLGWRPEAMA